MWRSQILRVSRASLLFLIVSIVAGNISNSFLLKWGFRDGPEAKYGLLQMMDGTASRPFVYRSLLPRTIYQTVAMIPEETQVKLHQSILRFDALYASYFNRVPRDAWQPQISISFHVTYLVLVVAVMLALLLVFKLGRINGLDEFQSLGLVIGFGLLLPLVFQRGGYFYDFIELLGGLTVALLVIRQRMAVATLAIGVFSLNKETFFLFALAMFFLQEPTRPIWQRVAWTTLQAGVSLAGRHFIMSGFAQNPGGVVEFHLVGNLLFWLSPLNYLEFDNLIGRGIFTPKLQNPLIAVPLALFFVAAWRASPRHYRQYLLASFVLVLPLFLLFGYRDEWRNFSIMFPALVLIACYGVSQVREIFSLHPRT